MAYLGLKFRFSVFFLKKKMYLFIWKAELQRGREIFHPLVYFPNGCDSQGWARLKPKPSTHLGLSKWVTGAEAFGPSSTAVPVEQSGQHMSQCPYEMVAS